MKPVPEEIVDEIKRVIELIKEYEKIPQGVFGKKMLELAVAEGEYALASGDAAIMVEALKRLRGCE